MPKTGPGQHGAVLHPRILRAAHLVYPQSDIAVHDLLLEVLQHLDQFPQTGFLIHHIVYQILISPDIVELQKGMAVPETSFGKAALLFGRRAGNAVVGGFPDTAEIVGIRQIGARLPTGSGARRGRRAAENLETGRDGLQSDQKAVPGDGDASRRR